MNEKQISEKVLNEIRLIKPGEITETIDVPNGYLILMLENVVVEKFKN